MKVLLVSPAMELGGAERVIVELVRRLPAHGVQVTLVAPSGALDAELPSRTARFVLPAGGRSPLHLLRMTGGIARALRSVRPDVVHAHNPKASLAGALAIRSVSGLSPPLVTTFHGVAPGEYPRAARLLALTDRIVCVSEDTRAQLAAAGQSDDRLTVIENGVAALPGQARERVRDGGPIVTAVGRLVAQKAHERFIQMAAVVAAQHSNARFLVIGEGPRRAELEHLSERLGLADRVDFLGARMDARELIAISDLLVFSSSWEGLSVAALEALSAGVPVVSTPVQGMRAIQESGAGEVVGEASAEALAASVLKLLDDHEERRRMGAAGRELIANRFNPERMTAAYAALYARVIG